MTKPLSPAAVKASPKRMRAIMPAIRMVILLYSDVEWRSGKSTAGGAFLQEGPVAGVLSERGRVFESFASLLEPLKLLQQIAAYAGKQVIALQRRLIGERIDDLEAGSGAERHPDGHGAIEFNNRRRSKVSQRIIERGDALPVCFGCDARARMARGYRGLRGVGPERRSGAFGSFECSEAAANEPLIPLRPILIEQEHRFAGGVHARPHTRSLDFHQCDESVNLGFERHHFGENAPEANRFLHERRPQHIVTRTRRIAFVEDEI